MITNPSTIADPYAEQQITAFGTSWSIQIVKLDDIDEKASADNHARRDKQLNDELAMEYALAMERGDRFPRPVLMKFKTGKYCILGGAHRIAAWKMVGIKEVEAYVVESNDDQTKDLLPRVLNRGHGLRQTQAEAIENAIFAHERHGLTCQRASEIFGIRVETVNEEIKFRKVSETLADKGIRTQNIGKTAILKLNAIPTESVMVSAARVVADSRMTLRESEEFIKEIRGARKSEAAAMAVVANWEDRISKPVNGEIHAATKKAPMKINLLRTITVLENYLKDKTSLSQFGIAGDEIKKIKQRLNELQKKIYSLSR